MVSLPPMTSSESSTALSAPMPSALRTTSAPLGGAMVRMVTVVSPPCASFILKASSIAYSSNGLSTFSMELRFNRLVVGSNVFSAFVSGTCLTVTTIFKVEAAPERRRPRGRPMGNLSVFSVRLSRTLPADGVRRRHEERALHDHAYVSQARPQRRRARLGRIVAVGRRLGVAHAHAIGRRCGRRRDVSRARPHGRLAVSRWLDHRSGERSGHR